MITDIGIINLNSLSVWKKNKLQDYWLFVCRTEGSLFILPMMKMAQRWILAFVTRTLAAVEVTSVLTQLKTVICISFSVACKSFWFEVRRLAADEYNSMNMEDYKFTSPLFQTHTQWEMYPRFVYFQSLKWPHFNYLHKQKTPTPHATTAAFPNPRPLVIQLSCQLSISDVHVTPFKHYCLSGLLELIQNIHSCKCLAVTNTNGSLIYMIYE